jgi:multicomponent Na+:H+ antiporter subunit G
MVGRAGYRTKHLHPELLSTDELEAVVQQAAGKRGFDGENPDDADPPGASSAAGSPPRGAG